MQISYARERVVRVFMRARNWSDAVPRRETSGQSLANFLPNTMKNCRFIRATGTKTRESKHLR